jgi:hypothetical protein
MKWLDHDSMDEMIEAAWVGFEEPALAALTRPEQQNTDLNAVGLAVNNLDEALQLISELKAMLTTSPRQTEGLVAIADKIERQAECLKTYAEGAGFEVRSVFHSQAIHFRDYANELRAALLNPGGQD